MIGKKEIRVGARFLCNANGATIEVVRLECDRQGKPGNVAVKDLRSGHVFPYGLEALRRCDITIIKEGTP